MTSAAELFHSRRYRFGLRHNALDLPAFDSSLPDTSSSSSHQHRTIIRRHSHYYSSQNNRREHRHDFDGCDPASRRIHRRRLNHSEHEPVHPAQGHGQSPSGSIINADDFRTLHRHRATGNERLPGSVLLARERLLERLRGFSVSGNRQSSSRPSSRTHQDEFSSLIGIENNLLEIRGEQQEEMASESLTPIPSQETTRNHPSGLTPDALNCLPLEVFSNDERSSASRECTICLENFQDGDTMIRLHCMHRFHSCCLFPWVRMCGACPNCRKTIFVNIGASFG